MRGALPYAAGERAARIIALSLGSFLGQILSDIQGFFNSISNDITSAVNTVVNAAAFDAGVVLSVWQYQVGLYGIWVPLVLVVTILPTAGIVYLILGFGDAVNEELEL